MSSTKSQDLPSMSYVLKNVSSELKPTEPVACMNCPVAIWMVTDTSLSCHCRILYKTTWATEQVGKIRQCDIPEQARAEAEMQAAEPKKPRKKTSEEFL